LDREVESISLPSFAQYLLVYERKTAVLLSKHEIVLILVWLHNFEEIIRQGNTVSILVSPK